MRHLPYYERARRLLVAALGDDAMVGAQALPRDTIERLVRRVADDLCTADTPGLIGLRGVA